VEVLRQREEETKMRGRKGGRKLVNLKAFRSATIVEALVHPIKFPL
jgi:hypothetical protein